MRTIQLTINQRRSTSGMQQVVDMLKGKSIASVAPNGLGMMIQTTNRERIYIGWDAQNGPYLERLEATVTIPDIDVETVSASVQGG